MDKGKAFKYFLMAIGFVGAGIGGAVTAGEIPENVQKAKDMLKEKPKEPAEDKAGE